MARWSSRSSPMQRELLALLRPRSARLEQTLSEQVRPKLAEVGRAYAGRPEAQIVPALEAVVRSAGAEPDMAALHEFAELIAAGQNPFE